MAILADVDRVEIWAEFQRDISNNREGAAFLKADLRAAVNAADQWVSDNGASYNSALPVAFRTGATAAQKARLLAWVLKMRFARGT